MGRHRRTAADLALVTVVVVLLGTVAAVSLGTQPMLVVADEEGETLLSIPVETGDTVVLEYTHSVEKTTVRDVYTVRHEGIVLTRMEFSSYGAGLPSNAPVERTDEGTFVYEPPGMEPGELLVSTGEIAGHELLLDDRRYDLVEHADGGTVVLSVENSHAR